MGVAFFAKKQAYSSPHLGLRGEVRYTRVCISRSFLRQQVASTARSPLSASSWRRYATDYWNCCGFQNAFFSEENILFCLFEKSQLLSVFGLIISVCHQIP